MKDTWDDEDMGGLSVEFEYFHTQTIYGARDSLGGVPNMGPPIEPDELIYRYEVQKVSLYDVTLDMDDLDLKEYYEDEVDLCEDVSEKVSKSIQEHMGINPYERSVPQEFGEQNNLFNKKGK